MARVSTKANKNIYQRIREALHLTRETASDLLESLPPERIEKIENERSLPHPDEVLLMAEKYKQPNLCNYYCANQCPIGQQYVPEVKVKDLSQIVLEMLASLNSMNKQKDRLIEITSDGAISEDELADFIFIQQELERISITVETLQLWAERMLATGAIDAERYQAYKEKLEKRSSSSKFAASVEISTSIFLILCWRCTIFLDTMNSSANSTETVFCEVITWMRGEECKHSI